MNWILDLLKAFWRLLIWWVVVEPWDQGLRVRLGTRRQVLTPGVHFRIPYLDRVYKQSVRLRWAPLPTQTVTTRDGYTITLCGQLGYEIRDIERLYNTLNNAENGIRALAQGAISQYVHTHELNECAPAAVEAGALASVDLQRYGMVACQLQLTTFCRVKSYRFITDHHETWIDDMLQTSKDDTAVKS